MKLSSLDFQNVEQIASARKKIDANRVASLHPANLLLLVF